MGSGWSQTNKASVSGPGGCQLRVAQPQGLAPSWCLQSQTPEQRHRQFKTLSMPLIPLLALGRNVGHTAGIAGSLLWPVPRDTCLGPMVSNGHGDGSVILQMCIELCL